MKFLNEIDGAHLLKTDPNNRLMTDVEKTALSNKVDKVSGKGLSTTDFTSAEKTKLSGIATGANKYVLPSSLPYAMLTGTPASLPANGGNASTVSGYTVGVSVPSNAKFTDTTYGVATTTANGLLSSADKTKLNSVESGAVKITLSANKPSSGWWYEEI